jgi:type IV pilus assembly protein PilM
VSERRIIGLDIGSAAVRAAEVTVHDRTPSLHNFGQVALPPGAVTAGVIIDAGIVTMSIQRLWKENKFSGRDVIMGVSSGHVVVRAIELPWVEPEDLQKSLPYLVTDVLPIPVEDVLLDFLPFQNEPVKGEPIHGLLVASPREHVIAMVRCAEKAGLQPVGVDLASFALLRAIALGSAPPELDEPDGDWRKSRFATEAVVDIGDSVTNIVVHQGGVPKVVRILPRGGADVTATLADRLGVSPAEAEVIKRQEGMNSTDTNIETLIRLAVTPLIQQLRGSVEYFTAGHSGARVDRILLCGGGALLPGLPETMTRELGIETQLIDPMADLVIQGKHLDQGELQSFRPFSAVPIGLALGAA